MNKYIVLFGLVLCITSEKYDLFEQRHWAKKAGRPKDKESEKRWRGAILYTKGEKGTNHKLITKTTYLRI